MPAKSRFILVLLGTVLVLPAWATLPIQTWQAKTGAKVMFVENHNIPMLDVALSMDAGGRRLPFAKAGLASLVASNLDAGTKKHDEEQLAEAFADLGAQFGVAPSLESVEVKLRTLSFPVQRDPALALMTEILNEPVFPVAALERKKAQMIAALKQESTLPGAIADKALTRLMYGRHPYGIGAATSPETVGAIRRDDVLAFYKANYRAKGAVVSLVGDITRQQAEQIAEQLTSGLPQGQEPAALPSVVVNGGQTERIAHPANQATILIGMPVLKRHDPDYYALLLGDYILGGGGFESRLMKEVREKRGLVYGVSSGFTPLSEAGEFQISLQTERSQANAALKLVRDVLDDFVQQGPSDAEIAAAKANLINGFAMRTDSNAKVLDWLTIIGMYNLPLTFLDDYPGKLQALTAAQVRDAFQRRIQLNQLSTVLVAADEPAKAEAKP